MEVSSFAKTVYLPVSVFVQGNPAIPRTTPLVRLRNRRLEPVDIKIVILFNANDEEKPHWNQIFTQLL